MAPSSATARVHTTIGTTIYVEYVSTKGARALRESIERAHEETEGDLGRAKVARVDGYAKTSESEGIWVPINDAALMHERFEVMMAQISCENGNVGDGEEMEKFASSASPAALRALNRKTLVKSPLLSSRDGAMSPGIGAIASTPNGVDFQRAQHYGERRSILGTPAAATPRAFLSSALVPMSALTSTRTEVPDKLALDKKRARDETGVVGPAPKVLKATDASVAPPAPPAKKIQTTKATAPTGPAPNVSAPVQPKKRGRPPVKKSSPPSPKKAHAIEPGFREAAKEASSPAMSAPSSTSESLTGSKTAEKESIAVAAQETGARTRVSIQGPTKVSEAAAMVAPNNKAPQKKAAANPADEETRPAEVAPARVAPNKKAPPKKAAANPADEETRPAEVAPAEEPNKLEPKNNASKKVAKSSPAHVDKETEEEPGEAAAKTTAKKEPVKNTRKKPEAMKKPEHEELSEAFQKNEPSKLRQNLTPPAAEEPEEPWDFVEEAELMDADVQPRRDEETTRNEAIANILAKGGGLRYSLFVKEFQTDRGCVRALERLKMDSFDALKKTTQDVIEQVKLVQDKHETSTFDDIVVQIESLRPAPKEELVPFLAVSALIARLNRGGYKNHKRVPTSLVHGFKNCAEHSSDKFGVVERAVVSAVMKEIGYDGEPPRWLVDDDDAAGSAKIDASDSSTSSTSAPGVDKEISKHSDSHSRSRSRSSSDGSSSSSDGSSSSSDGSSSSSDGSSSSSSDSSKDATPPVAPSRAITPRPGQRDEEDARAIKASQQGGLMNILASINPKRGKSKGGDASKRSTSDNGKLLQTVRKADRAPAPTKQSVTNIDVEVGKRTFKCAVNEDYVEVDFKGLQANFYYSLFKNYSKMTPLFVITTKEHRLVGKSLTGRDYVGAVDGNVNQISKWKNVIKLVQHYPSVSIFRFLEQLQRLSTDENCMNS